MDTNESQNANVNSNYNTNNNYNLKHQYVVINYYSCFLREKRVKYYNKNKRRYPRSRNYY